MIQASKNEAADMNCPRCQSELNKVSFPNLDNASIHMCPSCEGAWYPLQSLESLTLGNRQDVENSELAPALVADKLQSINLDEPVNCPECNKEMSRYSYALAPDTQLDQCEEHGMWLDDGELGVMLDQISDKSEKIAEAREQLAAKRKEMDIDGIAKGSPFNPFALTLRVLNGLFIKG